MSSEHAAPKSAMILAAGLGVRMRPLSNNTPKPLIKVAGKTLIEYNLDALAKFGVTDVIVNIHYLRDQMKSFFKDFKKLKVYISDEERELLDSGGGVKRALPFLGKSPFFVLNSDSFWLDGPVSNLKRLINVWNPLHMDILLMLAAGSQVTGYNGYGDFIMDSDGKLIRRPERIISPFIYTGVAIINPKIFTETPEGPFSLNLLFDRAIKSSRLNGIRLDGQWFHVGTPQAIQEAEQNLLLHKI